MKPAIVKHLVILAAASLFVAPVLPPRATAAQGSQPLIMARDLPGVAKSPNALSSATSKSLSFTHPDRFSTGLLAMETPGPEGGGAGPEGGGAGPEGGGAEPEDGGVERGTYRPNRGIGSNAAIKSLAQKYSLDPNKFGRFVEEEKEMEGRANMRGKGGDYSYKELEDLAKQFKELQRPFRQKRGGADD